MLNTNPHFTSDYQAKSLKVLNTALNYLGAYKNWQQYDPGESYPTDQRYAALPVLTKKDIREHFPEGFVPPGQDLEKALADKEIEFVKTSGSIDISVTNIWYQKWWDASETASWKLNAITAELATGNQLEAILVNPMNVGIISDDRPLTMEERRLSRFLYLNEKTSPASWTNRHMDRMAEELNSFQPTILEANPSLLAKLCRYLISTGKSVYQPGLITFTYEYPAVFQLRQIQRVFKGPMASSYGSTETGYVFMQCEKGKYHQNTETCRVDFQPLKKEHGGPDIGRILVTTFDNPWYYLLRFYVGDLVRLDKTGVCACGRNCGYILAAIEGRAFSTTVTTQGRLVTLREADNVLSSFEAIDEYKLEQTSGHNYEVHLVSKSNNRTELNRNVTLALKKLYGVDATVNIDYVEIILPENSGKHCLTKTTFPIEMENYLA